MRFYRRAIGANIPTKPSKKQFELNAKWTSIEKIHGWLHYRVCTRRNGENGLEVELMAVCDRAVRFWLPRAEMLDAQRWLVGWHDLPQS